MDYGVNSENIINHPFTSLYKSDIDQKITNIKEKENLREKLGMKEDKIVISVGRFSYMNGYGKGYDVLLKSAQNMDSTTGWYIIGGKPKICG